MAKLSLTPEATFKAKALIPIPGVAPIPVEFTFKHRTKDELRTWLTSTTDQSDAEVVLDVATSWDLDDKFDAENIKRLCDNYAGAGHAIVTTYITELRGVRA